MEKARENEKDSEKAAIEFIQKKQREEAGKKLAERSNNEQA